MGRWGTFCCHHVDDHPVSLLSFLKSSFTFFKSLFILFLIKILLNTSIISPLQAVMQENLQAVYKVTFRAKFRLYLTGNPCVIKSQGLTGASVTEFWGFFISFSNGDFLFTSLCWMYKLGKTSTKCYHCFVSFFNHSKGK